MALPENNRITIRLHLVRHAETDANLQHTVIGQSDSPLTSDGIEQALSLGAFYQSQWFSSLPDRSPYFSRIYSSDLRRTKHTAQLVLANADTGRLQELQSNRPSNICDTTYDLSDTIGLRFGVRYDLRLREIARGLNQGLPKQFTDEQAMNIFKSGKHPLYSCHDADMPLPISESSDEVWDRIYTSWFMEIVHDVCESQVTDRVQCSSTCFNVLAFTHGALLRTFLQRLLGQERLKCHSDARYKTVDSSNENVARLDIPNTSVTILDVHIDATTLEIVETDIVQLASTQHLICPKTTFSSNEIVAS